MLMSSDSRLKHFNFVHLVPSLRVVQIYLRFLWRHIRTLIRSPISRSPIGMTTETMVVVRSAFKNKREREKGTKEKRKKRCTRSPVNPSSYFMSNGKKKLYRKYSLCCLGTSWLEIVSLITCRKEGTHTVNTLTN